jgi:hypothetical protein
MNSAYITVAARPGQTYEELFEAANKLQDEIVAKGNEAGLGVGNVGAGSQFELPERDLDFTVEGDMAEFVKVAGRVLTDANYTVEQPRFRRDEKTREIVARFRAFPPKPMGVVR